MRVRGSQIPESVIQAGLQLMSKPFIYQELVKVLKLSGSPARGDTIQRLADRILIIEKREGNIVFDGSVWNKVK